MDEEPTQATESGGTMSVTEVTGLVQLFNNSLLAMEGRLIAKMDENSRRASERWAKHDLELEANTKRIVARFEKVEASITLIEKSLKEHLDKEHDDELVVQARVKPITTVAGYIAKNWRTILLLIVSVLAILGFSGETLQTFLK